MTDRNGTQLQPGDRVRHQVSPRLPWTTGTVTADGRHVREDYNGRVSRMWTGYVELAR
jgi:hypothetical protein